MPEPSAGPDASPVEMFVTGVRVALAAAADATRAPQMQAYMKSDLPYFGIPSPALKALLGPLLATRLPTRADWESAVTALWYEATHREEWYAALALAGHRHYREHQDAAALELYAGLVVSGAWWDVVDDLATHKVGPILLRHFEQASRVIRAWAVSEDLWLRRTALICQLGAKYDTDLDLLDFALSANLEGSPYGEVFWIRKAVGWSLRQHARIDPDWVRRWVAEHDAELSGLSRREALRHLSP